MFFFTFPYFNSIKVQLEPFSHFRWSNTQAFQFHKGTIRTNIDYITPDSPSNFNSIKVQLELGFDIPVTNLPGFQFHKGTIRTPLPVPVLFQVIHFNSIKVQLERYNGAFCHSLKSISIP